MGHPPLYRGSFSVGNTHSKKHQAIPGSTLGLQDTLYTPALTVQSKVPAWGLLTSRCTAHLPSANPSISGKTDNRLSEDVHALKHVLSKKA